MSHLTPREQELSESNPFASPVAAGDTTTAAAQAGKPCCG